MNKGHYYLLFSFVPGIRTTCISPLQFKLVSCSLNFTINVYFRDKFTINKIYDYQIRKEKIIAHLLKFGEFILNPCTDTWLLRFTCTCIWLPKVKRHILLECTLVEFKYAIFLGGGDDLKISDKCWNHVRDSNTCRKKMIILVYIYA